MRYVGHLITAIRQRTDNEDFSEDASGNTTEGISPEMILEFMNDGQLNLQSEIISVYPVSFIAEAEINIVANQESYTIPDNLFINERILSVQYSHSGDTSDYAPLDQRPLRERITSTASSPGYYIRRSGTILLNPIPTGGGKIRVEYYRQIDKLDIRRGKITAATTSTIVLENDSNLDANELGNLVDGDYICIVDKYGVVQDYAVEVTSYTSGTRTLNIPTTTLTGGAGDYVVIGKYATTHSPLPDTAERFIKLYAQYRMLQKDSSQDATEELQEVERAKIDVINVFANPDEDVHFIPTLDVEILY